MQVVVDYRVDVSRAGTPISVYGIPRDDPGFLYMVESSGQYKVGRTKNPKARISAARTWLPGATLIGVKPFWQHRAAEFNLHLGLARVWQTHEWFSAPDEGYEYHLVEEFRAFSDTDIDGNSIDFIYWLNGSGMSEFVSEFFSSDQSKIHFLTTERIS